MRINTNASSMTAQGSVFKVDRALSKNIERLSTGLRINRASDDAAGLAVSEKMRAKVRGMAQAKNNAMDGISALNVAEGAMNEISNILQRQRELAVQASNATYSAEDRGYAQLEFTQLEEEKIRIIGVTQFNGMAMLGTAGLFKAGGAVELQVGANDTEKIDVTIANLSDVTDDGADTKGALLHDDDKKLDSFANAQLALVALDQTILNVNNERATVGSFVNRLESTVNNLINAGANQAAAESQIRDVDFTKESAEFTKNQILSQSSIAMLANANMKSQGALSLIG